MEKPAAHSAYLVLRVGSGLPILACVFCLSGVWGGFLMP